MTIAILFQQSHYRTFKAFYTEHVQQHLRSEFPHLMSYTRFVELLPTVLVPLIVYLHTQLGTCTGISLIDATALAVCKNPRISQHRVFTVDARRGKTSVGWFYGFKLHLVVNDRGELLAFCLTPGNVDDRRPVPRLARRLFGKLFGDKGYISQDLAAALLVEQGVQLITKLRKNMHTRLLDLGDKLLLRKRALIESMVDELKNVCETLALAPSQSRQLPGPPDGRAHRLLPSAQEALVGPRSAGPACGCLAYPELTLRTEETRSAHPRRSGTAPVADIHTKLDMSQSAEQCS